MPQYLSTDPNAGVEKPYLSTDPNADGQAEPSAQQAWLESHGASPERAQQWAADMAAHDAHIGAGDQLKEAALGLVGGKLFSAGAGLLSKVPVGRLLTATKNIGPEGIPFVGKQAKRFVEGWRAGAPKPAAPKPTPTGTGTGTTLTAPVVHGGWSLPRSVTAPKPAPKPKLSAQQTKQMMREQYGAERGGRMLFGKAREGVSAAGRTDLMRKGTTGGALPKAAQRAIEKELAGSSADKAFAYAAKAPNQQAEEHFGELLKRALQARMSGK